MTAVVTPKDACDRWTHQGGSRPGVFIILKRLALIMWQMINTKRKARKRKAVTITGQWLPLVVNGNLRWAFKKKKSMVHKV